MKKEFKRQIFVFENHFREFKQTLDRDTLKKVYQVLEYIMLLDIIPARFLKSIEGTNGLFEIRVESGSNIYRIFCCFDEGNLVILFNGFQKKTQKTPPDQIAKAEGLMKKYFEQKNTHPNENK